MIRKREMKDVPPFERGLSWERWMVTNERDGSSPLDKIIARGKASARARAPKEPPPPRD
jgi:hypothetical protein